MQKLLPFIALLIFLLSCNKEKELVPEMPVDLTDSIEGSKFEVTMSKSLSPIKPDETYHLLGFGYDVTGAFADANSAREYVIDVEKYKQESSSAVALSLSKMGSSKNYIATNAEDYSRWLTSRVNSIKGQKLFKSSVTSFFPDSNSLSDKYLYGTYSFLIQQKGAKFMAFEYDKLFDYVTPGFSRDLQTLSPENLVKKYGTHILSDIVLGAKFEVLYQAETKNPIRENATTLGLTVGLRSVFGLFSGHLDFSSLNTARGNFSQKIHYKAFGGDTTKIPTPNRFNREQGVIDITSWAQTSNMNNLALIDIREQGLTPLWYAIEDPVKKAAVKTYVERYLADNEVN